MEITPLILLAIPSPSSVYALRGWIDDIEKNVQAETSLVARVEFCYQSQQNGHFALLSLFNKDQSNQYAPFDYPELLDASIDPPISPSAVLPFPNLHETPLSELIHDTIGTSMSTKHALSSCHSRLEAITGHFSNEADPEAYVRSICAQAKSTVVHAELVLLDWFRRTNSKFVAEDRYIACSKDTCYSCDRYVQALPRAESVALRGWHNKWYLAWRPPDIPSGSGAQVSRDECMQLEGMMRIVRSDLLQNLQQAEISTWYLGSSTGATLQANAALKERWQAELTAGSQTNGEELTESAEEWAANE
ncbi:hypothetical protein MMC13_003897 [Lambiella insularis]|nr:hypothetical protein [Lambiella insularis]